jgi:tryptophan synthase alpha chain
MSRLSDAVSTGKGLICFLTAGYPSEEECIEYALACVRGGAAVIELGVPFSDPVADGKVIQFTSQKALEAGVTPARVFDLVRELRKRTAVPIVLMGYYNPIFRIGEAEYARRTREAGADGLIVPDLPLEESRSLQEHCRSQGVDLVQLVGPTTSEERMRAIARCSSGFLYLVSSLGTTGARRELGTEVAELVARAKRAAGPVPLGVGFGVSRPEQVVRLRAAGGDAAIVGSAILQMIIDGQSPDEVEAFVRSLTGEGR